MAHLNTVSNHKDSWSEVKAGLFAIGIFNDFSLSSIGKTVNEYLDGQITKAIDLGDIKGKEGETSLFYGPDRRILVLGLGESEKFDTESVRRAGGKVSKFAIAREIATVSMEVFGNSNADYHSQALVEGIILGSYQFLDYKTQNEDSFELEAATIVAGSDKGISKGQISANGVCFARDLSNHPGNIATPTKLAEAAKSIAMNSSMKLTVLDRAEFTKMGMGALAGVAAGSDEPPKFIVLEYYGADKDEKPVILVGKGLTFDSGGISIKPANKMEEMKFDMCGSGVVLGVMKALSLSKPKLNVVGIIASTENLSGGKALKPGDILTAYNGKTIEIQNTDAEGRLILADALSYACKHFDPEYILDFATLTGAVVITLGHVATAILGTDRNLIEAVKKSSGQTGERVWELPLWNEYLEHIKSEIADVKNTGEPRQAGTIAGGAFLKEFVNEDIPWVHFDIAGSAYGGKEKPYNRKNEASGVMVRLVLDLLEK